MHPGRLNILYILRINVYTNYMQIVQLQHIISIASKNYYDQTRLKIILSIRNIMIFRI